MKNGKGEKKKQMNKCGKGPEMLKYQRKFMLDKISKVG